MDGIDASGENAGMWINIKVCPDSVRQDAAT